MEATDVKGIHAEIKKRMDGHIEFVRKELAGVRTGRASTDMLAGVTVEAYGSKMPINQVASLSIPEPALIVAQPFDPSIMSALERAVNDAATDYDTAVWFDASGDVGNSGAASAGASLAKACLALRQEILPDNPPRYWLHDRDGGAPGRTRRTVPHPGQPGAAIARLCHQVVT